MKNYFFCMFLLVTTTTIHTHTFVMRVGVTAIGLIAAKTGLDLMAYNNKSSLRWTIDKLSGVILLTFGTGMVILEPIIQSTIAGAIRKYYPERVDQPSEVQPTIQPAQ